MRRTLRILIIISFISLFSLAVVAHWWGVWVALGWLEMRTSFSDLSVSWWANSHWGAGFSDQTRERYDYYIDPFVTILPGLRVLYVPWWIVAVAWLTVAGPLWWLTRKRKVPAKAFPVEAKGEPPSTA